MLDPRLCGVSKTEQEAEDYLRHYVVDHGDDAAVTNMLAIFGVQSELTPEVMEDFKFHFKAGHGGYPLIGSPQKIVEDIEHLSSFGVDGMLISG